MKALTYSILASLLWLSFGAAAIRAAAQTFQELHAFCHWDNNVGWWNCSDGGGPEGALIQGEDGNFYGTTSQGGEWGCGTAFRLGPDGGYSVLASFDGTNGSSPRGSLLQAADGCFYGTTLSGQTGHGSIFRCTSDGVLSRLYRFDGWDGDAPVGDLVQGPDGKLYGATGDGGGNGGAGTIFRIATNAQPWELETLAVFYFDNGRHPSGGLVLARDGNFYGVTAGGGAGYGTVYRLETNGVVSTVASFVPDGNVWPTGRLIEAPDGSFYGAADNTIFRVTREGTLTTVGDFGAYGPVNNGEYPVGPLTLARDGNFYGSCYGGGTNCCPPYGTVFRMTPGGTLTALFSFTGYGGQFSGAYPHAGLVQGNDGNLYGTTRDGGAPGGGNIFRIIMPGPFLGAARARRDLVLSWRTNYTGYRLQSTTGPNGDQWSDCTNATSITSGQYFVTNSITDSARFFRLSQVSQPPDTRSEGSGGQSPARAHRRHIGAGR